MVTHHCFYAHLDNRVVQDGFHLDGQELTRAMGNLIANCARVVLTAAIGIAFVQVLWLHLRRCQYSVSDINAFMACNGSPFTPSSILTWVSPAFFLAIIALCSTLMTAVTIFSPGAIIIPSPTMTRNLSCTVLNINIANGQYGIPSAPQNVETFPVVPYVMVNMTTSRIVAQGTYLPPILSCNASCQYNLEFIAPSLKCTNITDLVDFNVTLPFSGRTPSGGGVVSVWNATNARTSRPAGDDLIVLQIAAGTMQTNADNDAFPGPGQAISCTFYNATYRATVLQGVNSSAVAIESVQLHNRIPTFFPLDVSNATSNQLISLQALAVASWDSIMGYVEIQSDPVGIYSVSSVMMYSGMVEQLARSMPIDLMSAIPGLMQNMSISLLSGVFDAGGPSNLVPFDTTCLYYASIYHYTRWKLLAPYGACIFIAAICSLLGAHAVLVNGGGESLEFSRLLESTRMLYSLDDLSMGSTPLPPDTKLGITDDGYFERLT